jgi:carboxyl-terminal processing protease
MFAKPKLNLNHIRNFFLLLSFGILVFAGGYQTAKLRSGAAGSEIVKKFVGTPMDGAVTAADFSKFWEVWKRLENYYVDPSKLDYAKMTWGAMQGLSQSLDDPYTQYLPPKENKQASEDLNGAFFGVGIELGYKESTLAVISPIKNSPAEKAGVKAGDLILHIKDEKKKVDVDTS